MTISVFSGKGGVGKTSLSFSIAKDFDYSYMTNDLSSAVMNFGNQRKANYRKGELPLRDDTLYDFGGFEDENAHKIILQSDVLVIPTIDDFNAMMKCMNVLRKYKGKNIVLVANAIEKKDAFTNIQLILEQNFRDTKYKLVHIPRTKMFKNALDNKKSATELFRENSVYDRGFKGYLELLHAIKSFEKKEVVA